ncbi:transposable element Tcb2 transposase [Trichonephila clavipes]|nr:transposable element Tcb2 transposase [Trichonephila clavipes]
MSSRTILRPLAERHLESRHTLRVLPLTPTHRRLLLEWCHALENWTAAEWNQGSFNDESRFNLSNDCNRVRVWRPRVVNASNLPFLYSDTQLPQLCDAQWYVHDILQPHVLPLVQRFPGAIFQQDNARPYTTRDCLHTVVTLPRPARSSHLSPIEHMWDHLGRRVERTSWHPTSLNELEARVTGGAYICVRVQGLLLSRGPETRSLKTSLRRDINFDYEAFGQWHISRTRTLKWKERVEMVEKKLAACHRNYQYAGSGVGKPRLVAGAGVFCDLFSFYLHVDSHTTHYDGEIEAIHLALHQLSARLSTPDKAVILSSSALRILASKQDKKIPEFRIAGSC